MKKSIFLALFLSFGWLYSQDLVLIKFKDKPSSDTYFANPNLMLSQKALDRRAKYAIPLNMQDVPVEETYVNQVEALGIVPVQVSKWFNGVFAWCTDTQVSQMEALTFVDGVESFVRDPNARMEEGRQLKDKFDVGFVGNPIQNGAFDFNYGATSTQVTQLKLDYLHNLGFTGEGITIAVMDNGFPGVESVDGFSYIRNNNQIKGTYNFVNHNEEVYGGGTHGTIVLSTIGGYLENEFVGTAIDADFYLFVTENTEHELPDEEVNWIAAAEKADSLGVDVINTSLGYSEFDDPRYNYVYDDMDGQTAYITRGAQIAAEKGMMVVVSAGNSGNDPWHYITSPADGVDVFTAGAVDADGNPAGFSSFGPTADGRIKPDVDALGSYASVIRPDGSIDYASGTSFSSPILSGAMACLVQAFPEMHPMALRQKVRESANYFNNPTDQLGYGIPDFSVAYNTCLGTEEVEFAKVEVFPNPTSGLLEVVSELPIKHLELVNFTGKIVRNFQVNNQLNLEGLPKGIYLLKIQLVNGKTVVKKVMKK